MAYLKKMITSTVVCFNSYSTVFNYIPDSVSELHHLLETFFFAYVQGLGDLFSFRFCVIISRYDLIMLSLQITVVRTKLVGVGFCIWTVQRFEHQLDYFM